MASYKNSAALSHSNDAAFDIIYSPGMTPPHGGVYRCLGCNREIASNTGMQLPPHNHHQHLPSQGTVRWQMIVYAEPGS